MKKLAYLPVFLAFATLAFLAGCSQGTPQKQQQEEKMDIYIDESYKPLFETAIPTFLSQQESGKIVPHYVSELEAINAFANDSTSTICISREFTKKETEELSKKQIQFRSSKLGSDAVCIIVNPKNADSSYTLDQLKAIFTGKDTLWKTSKRKIQIVFDHANSSNFYYIYNLIGKQKLGDNVSAVKSNEQVIDLVRKNPDVMGIIGANWISDNRDTTHLKFSEGISVCSIAYSKYTDYYQPFAAYIYNNIYPMTRNFYLINKASRVSINSQFARFLLGQRGQLLIYKSNLIPATMVAREIQIVQE